MLLMKRRDFLKVGAAAGRWLPSMAVPEVARPAAMSSWVGGGYGGATVAKYLRMWSEGGVQVTLIERNPTFISCPISNLVIGGQKTMEDITISYEGLRNKWGVRVIQDDVVAVDAAKKTVSLKGGSALSYDRLVLSPGLISCGTKSPAEGCGSPGQGAACMEGRPANGRLAQAAGKHEGWRRLCHLHSKAPYRCPPGPYERACLVANYFKQNKPKSKVVILDANEDVMSKKGLFTKAWSDLYKGIVEYRNNSEVKDVEVGSNTAVLEFDKFKADVLNVIPPHRAGDIAHKSGIKLVNNRWVDINWLSMESTSTPGIHVLGDAIFPAPTMPKSGHMANQHGKLAAAAILNMLSGQEPSPEPVVMNTCYSFVDSKNVIHVSSVHQYDAATKTVQPVKGRRWCVGGAQRAGRQDRAGLGPEHLG